jgi:hypothetical protein
MSLSALGQILKSRLMPSGELKLNSNSLCVESSYPQRPTDISIEFRLFCEFVSNWEPMTVPTAKLGGKGIMNSNRFATFQFFEPVIEGVPDASENSQFNSFAS